MPTKEDFQKIRDNESKLALVGYGGAMFNMLNVINHFALKHSEIGVFEKIVIFERDTIDFTNLFRFGKPVAQKQIPTARSNPDEIQGNIALLKKLHLVDDEKFLSKERKIIVFDEWLKEEHAKVLSSKGYTLVGAPGIETRNMLSEFDFYFLGHSGFEVDLAHRQEEVSDLVQETYGTVDIPALLVNFTIATCAFIKELTNKDRPQESERLLLRFDLKDYISKKEGRNS
jgi:hypothetical protein